MPRITITIDTDNAAFSDGPGIEVARILHRLAENVEGYMDEDDFDGERLMDYNGNHVGSVTVEEG